LAQNIMTPETAQARDDKATGSRREEKERVNQAKGSPKEKERARKEKYEEKEKENGKVHDQVKHLPRLQQLAQGQRALPHACAAARPDTGQKTVPYHHENDPIPGPMRPWTILPW
jgi:hypothetical protein